MALTSTANAALAMLTGPVGVMSDNQVGRTLFASTASPAANARRMLAKLANAGLVHLFRAPAHPEISLREPVISWAPGGLMPDLGHVAYVLNRRWTRPPVLTTCVCATRKGRNLFNGRGGKPPEVKLTHDLHLAAVYLALLRSDPVAAKYWISEEQVRLERERLDERIPDAIVRKPGAPPRVIEFGGTYKKPKLEAFHRHCSFHSLAYEIW